MRRFVLRELRYTTRIEGPIDAVVNLSEVWWDEGDSGMCDSGSPLVPYPNTTVGPIPVQLARILRNQNWATTRNCLVMGAKRRAKITLARSPVSG